MNIDEMHKAYGTRNSCATCGWCDWYHWHIRGSGKEAYQDYRWCEQYGLNKEDVTASDWDPDWKACGLFKTLTL